MVTRLKAESIEEHDLQQESLQVLLRMTVGQLPELDELVTLVADIFQADIALAALFDGGKQQFISAVGTPLSSIEVDEGSFHRMIIERNELFVVQDSHVCPEFSDNPYLNSQCELRFCAGLPLFLQDDIPIGVLSLFSTQPQQFSERDRLRLQRIARAVEGLLRSQLNAIKADIASQIAQSAQNMALRKGQLLEEVAKVSGVGGWELDVESDELYWTEKTREIHQVSDDYVPTLEEAINFYAPAARPLIEKAVQDGLNSTGIWDFELPLITAKGKSIWVKATGQAVFENGKLKRLIGGCQDITSRREQELRLRESESTAREKSDELYTIIANMRQGVAVFDEHTHLKYSNSQYRDILNRNEKQMVYGTPFLQLLSELVVRSDFELSPECIFREMQSHFARGDSMAIKYSLVHGRIVAVLYTPLPDGGWVTTVEDITEREKAAEKIAFAARHDPLTGLANRMLFNQVLEEALARELEVSATSGSHGSCALLMLDLDRFKPVNDTHGHIIGDEVLKEVAKRLTAVVKRSDLVARFGGDEFAILLLDYDNTEDIAIHIAESVIAALSDPFLIRDLCIAIGVSIGIAKVQASDKSLSDVIQRADDALYHVKHHGRDGYHLS